MALVDKEPGKIQRAVIAFRTSGWFANGLLILCAVWWIWNWFAPPLWHFDDRTLGLLVFLLSVEASWSNALIYQHTSRSDLELRRFLRESREEQADRVREIMALLHDASEDLEDIAMEVKEMAEGEINGGN